MKLLLLAGLSYLFLVGGFAESSMLQHELRQDFGHILRIIIPQGVGTITVKGKFRTYTKSCKVCNFFLFFELMCLFFKNKII